METKNEQSVGQTHEKGQSQGVAAVSAGSPFIVNDWLKRVIEGPSGMNAYERNEMISWNESDRLAAARWVVGCLSNPRCAGSAEMLQAIQDRREARMANT